MKKTYQRLPESELDIMLVLWNGTPPMTRPEIEKVINEKAKDGWEPVTFSVTNSCKAILVFRLPEDTEK